MVVPIDNKKTRGWIKLYRDINENMLWTSDEPFDRRSAWIDLLLMVNHEPKTILVDGQKKTIGVGQRWLSVRTLSQKWNWSKGRVERFMKLLEEDEMITLEKHKNGTLLTIVKYGFFQFGRDTDGTPTRTQTETQTGHQRGHQRDETRMNKNEKNYKNDEEGILSGKPDPVPDYFFDEVIGYLNQRAGTAFQAGSKDTRKLIKARCDDGFTLEDFKTVIDKKVAEWKDDEKMAAFLRPSTLFGAKFESYLNQQVVKGKSKNRFNNFPQRDYDFADFEKQLLNASLGGG